MEPSVATAQGLDQPAGKARGRILVLAGVAACVGGAVLLAAVLLVPWFNLEDTAMTHGLITVTGTGSHPAHDTMTILHLKSTTPFGYVILVSGALAIVVFALRLLRPAVSAILVGMAGVAFAVVALGANLYGIVSPPHVAYGGVTITNAPVVVTPGIGSLLGLVAGLAIAVGAAMTLVRGRRGAQESPVASSS
jgi:hypothetical protein